MYAAKQHPEQHEKKFVSVKFDLIIMNDCITVIQRKSRNITTTTNRRIINTKRTDSIMYSIRKPITPQQGGRIFKRLKYRQ